MKRIILSLAVALICSCAYSQCDTLINEIIAIKADIHNIKSSLFDFNNDYRLGVCILSISGAAILTESILMNNYPNFPTGGLVTVAGCAMGFSGILLVIHSHNHIRRLSLSGGMNGIGIKYRF